jgi:hypothetical protein
MVVIRAWSLGITTSRMTFYWAEDMSKYKGIVIVTLMVA